MKKTIQARQTAIALIILFALMIPQLAAYAADADFNGQGSPAVWQYDTVNVRAYGYDAFGDAMKGMNPGDAASVNVRLRNNTPGQVEFRLACSPVTGDAAKALEPFFPGKTAKDSLLDVIMIDVSHGLTQIYSGTLRGLAGIGDAAMYAADGVSLGLVSAGYSGTVTVALSVPASLDSSAMNTLCALEWRFIAAQLTEEPGTGPDPGGRQLAAGGGTAAALNAQNAATLPVIDDTPTDALPETATPGASGSGGPDIEVEGSSVPKAPGAGERAWALCNLLFAGLAGLQMLWLIVRRIIAKNREEEDAESQAGKKAYADRLRARRKLAALLVGVVGTICLVALFLLTEDMRLPMEYVNKYTICYIAVNLIEFAVPLFSAKKHIKATPQS
jgi:hypothetical protein